MINRTHYGSIESLRAEHDSIDYANPTEAERILRERLRAKYNLSVSRYTEVTVPITSVMIGLGLLGALLPFAL